jgi:hypothetical protein
MERYINRCPGQQRVQPEIDAGQVPGLLADIATIFSPSPETRELLAVLEEAHRAFGGGRVGQA